MRLAFGSDFEVFMEFKDKISFMGMNDYNKYYERLTGLNDRKTDLNKACISRIEDIVCQHGGSILDAAGGSGYLIERLYKYMKDFGTKAYSFSFCDIILPKQKIDEIKYFLGDLTNLPFADNAYETVICTHALEHIVDKEKALSELMRVASKKVIIVLPCQREYRFTFDLHVNFFPYKYNVERYLGKDTLIEKVDGDWFCIKKVI